MKDSLENFCEKILKAITLKRVMSLVLVREMAQLLRVPVALAEDLGSTPSTHTVTHCDSQPSLTPVLGDLMPSSDHYRHQAHQ